MESQNIITGITNGIYTLRQVPSGDNVFIAYKNDNSKIVKSKALIEFLAANGYEYIKSYSDFAGSYTIVRPITE